MIAKVQHILQRFLQLATLPTDSNELRLNKENLILMSTHFTMVGLIWGIVYFVNGLWLPSLIPFSYTILSTISIVILVVTRRFALFRNTQLSLVLLLPFLLHLSLGGFIQSSSVILWAIVCPMAALFFITIRQAVYWFAAFLGLIVIAFVIDDRLSQFYQWEITDSFIDALFFLNIVGVSGLVFLVQFYFARNERSLKKEVEQQNALLEVQSDQLKQLDKMKSNFFANISHEFRTPLTLIQGILNKSDVPSLDDQDIMKRNADRLLQLINQLLDLAKLESGKMKLVKKTIDLFEESLRMAQLFGSAVAMKNIQFHLNGRSIFEAELTPVLAVVDPKQIQKVLANLISNAVKFCPQDGAIDLQVEDAGLEVRLIMSNSAEEISQEQLDQIFNRFYQVESDSIRGYEGTGIGLSLVKEIVELHEGQISVTNKNHHIRFEIMLPKGIIGQAEAIDSAVAIPDPIPHFFQESQPDNGKDRIRILVVEDYPDLRKFIRDILKDTYQVLEATNGEEGVQLAITEMPDLIISDVMMPKKDGNQLCSELKLHPATDHIPIILLTARAGRADKIDGLDRGADDYLTKPFDEEELLIRIRNLLANRKRLQEKYQKEIWLKPSDIKVDSAQEKFIKRVKQAIDENLSSESLSAENLANLVALSRSQLHRKLKVLTGQSTTEFVRNYRLERAAELLKQEFGTVSEVAYEVGFNSPTYFTSSFTNHFGCSPTDFKSNGRSA